MKHLKTGDKAPDFSGKDQNGNTISLGDFKGKKLVVYFYPKDDTPGCTAQACSLRDNYALLMDKGISILGVSSDSTASHTKFITKYELPFSLISDENKEVISLFGVWGPKKFMGKEYDGIHRTTFLIDENQTIVEIINKPNTKEHAEEILKIFN
ncbi:MAG: thioredoxin-dependent thiol peroxidase [Bacteroidota bacterium]|jgi:peroxiredoxin Q/BCP